MPRIRFVMVGGFLGAGKTTTIARLARMYQAHGLRVGIITNDQATDLVDTHSLQSQGFPVGEVPGACFCCNFGELTATVESLADRERPDVVLAEPVGSCTDLVATVIQPLRRLYDQTFDVAPYAVTELNELVDAAHPGVPVLRVSARHGTGFDGLYQFLDQRGSFGRRILDLDYDTYAEGEAELGWLNSSAVVSATEPFALDELLLDVIARLRGSLAAAGAEPAHLKTIGLWEGFYGVANLVSSDSPPELSLASNCQVRDANLIVNTRVATDPKLLERLVHSMVAEACAARAARVEFRQTQSFRPGRPVPTHRFAEAV